MRVQDHIGLISWSLVDKGLYIAFGFVQIIILHYTSLSEFGLYALLIFLHSWIFTISDSFALQSLIQFGMQEESQKKVNLISLVTHIVLTFGVSLIIYFLRYPISSFFNEPRIIEIGNILPILSIVFIPKAFCQKIIYRIQNMFYLFLTNLAFFGITSFLIFTFIFLKNNLDFHYLSLFYLLGSLSSSIVAIVLTRKSLRFSNNGLIKIKTIFNFSWRMTSINLLNSFPKQIDPFIMKIFFPLETVALYSAAKNLFRLFDEAINALYGLLYPAGVKNLAKGTTENLERLLSKAVSFVFWGFIVISVVFISPVGSYIFDYIIPSSFQNSIDYFRLLLISTPFLSFIAFYSILTAENKLKSVFFAVLISNIFFFTVSLIVGKMHLMNYLPLGLISYNIGLGLIGLILGMTNYNFKLNLIFRAFGDSYNFLKTKLKIK
jgi:O-antigen/teichoic acid export membrane protein